MNSYKVPFLLTVAVLVEVKSEKLYQIKEKLLQLKRRLYKLGIEITITSNYPWIYLDEINGVKVIETTSDSNHGFNVGYLPVNKDSTFNFVNTRKMFKLIRKYIDHETKNGDNK